MGHGRFLRMWFNIVSSPPRSSQAITMLSSPPPFGCYFPLHCQSAVLLSETTTASAKNLAGPHPFLSYVLLPVSCFCVSCHIYCSLIFSLFLISSCISFRKLDSLFLDFSFSCSNKTVFYYSSDNPLPLFFSMLLELFFSYSQRPSTQTIKPSLPEHTDRTSFQHS